jgi:hypothetical protein
VFSYGSVSLVPSNFELSTKLVQTQHSYACGRLHSVEIHTNGCLLGWTLCTSLWLAHACGARSRSSQSTKQTSGHPVPPDMRDAGYHLTCHLLVTKRWEHDVAVGKLTAVVS